MADEISSKLGFDASQAIASIQSLKRELDSYNQALAKIAGGTKNFNTEQAKADDILKRLSESSQIAVGHLKELAGATNSAAAASKNLTAATREERAEQSLRNKALTLSARANRQQLADLKNQALASRTPFQQNLGIDPTSKPVSFGDQIGAASQQKQIESLKATEAALRSLGGRASATGQQIKNGADQGAQGAKNLELGWRSVIRIFAVQFAARAVSGIVQAFADGVKSARQFEIELAQILTISKEFEKSGIESVGDVVTKLSAQFGRPVEDVAKGLYQTLSNQIGDAAESTRFLADSLEFSVAAVTSSAEAVDLLSGVLNAYGLTAASTTRISDELFKTIELGRVTGTELANTYGRITTLSAQLGISTAEVNSAIAELTINGVDASDALTQVQNLFLKLVQPSNNTKKAFDELNISSAEAGIAVFGLAGFLEKLANGKTALSDVADLLGGRIRAIRGASTLLSNSERLNQTLKDIQNSAGATAKAFALIDATPAQKLTKQLEEARGTLVNGFGRTVIKTFSDFIDIVGGANNALIVLGGTMATLVGGSFLVLIGQAATALKTLGIAAVNANGALALIKFGSLAAIPIAAGIITVQILKIKDTATAAKQAISDLQDQASKNIKVRVADALPDVQKQQKSVKDQTALVIESLRVQLGAVKEAQVANITANASVTGDLAKNITDRSALVKASVKALQSLIDDAKSRTKTLSTEIRGLIGDINKGQFEKKVGGLDDQGQAVARLQKVDELASKANKLSLLGDPDAQKEALEVLKEAVGQAEKVADITDFQRFGDQKLNDLKTQALAIQKNITRVNSQDAKNAQTQLDRNDTLESKAASIEAAQTSVATASTKMQTAIENSTNKLITLQEQFAAAQKGVVAGFDAIRGNLDQSLLSAQRGEQNSPFEFGGTKKAVASAQSEVDSLEAIRTQALDAISKGDTKAVTDLQNLLLAQANQLEQQIQNQGIGAKLAAAIFGSSAEETKKSITVLSGQLGEAAKNLAALNAAGAEKSNLTDNINALNGFGEAAKNNQDILQQLPEFLKNVGVSATSAGVGLQSLGTQSTEATTGLENIQSSINSFSTENIVNQVSQAIGALQQLGNLNAGVPATAYFGGRMSYFANGGFARGQDTIPTMLSRGEFVMNAKATKGFHSQLVAMNAGRRPNFRNAGGEVTNVGDISVSVAGGDTSQQTINQIAKGLQRQIRQNRIKFK